MRVVACVYIHSICSFKILAQVVAPSIKMLPIPSVMAKKNAFGYTAHVFQSKQFVVSVSIDAPRFRLCVCLRVAVCVFLRVAVCVCVCTTHNQKHKY